MKLVPLFGSVKRRSIVVVMAASTVRRTPIVTAVLPQVYRAGSQPVAHQRTTAVLPHSPPRRSWLLAASTTISKGRLLWGARAHPFTRDPETEWNDSVLPEGPGERGHRILFAPESFPEGALPTRSLCVGSSAIHQGILRGCSTHGSGPKCTPSHDPTRTYRCLRDQGLSCCTSCDLWHPVLRRTPSLTWRGIAVCMRSDESERTAVAFCSCCSATLRTGLPQLSHHPLSSSMITSRRMPRWIWLTPSLMLLLETSPSLLHGVTQPSPARTHGAPSPHVWPSCRRTCAQRLWPFSSLVGNSVGARLNG